MSNWILITSHDWRAQRHALSYYGVEQYLNLDTGARRFVYNGHLYVWSYEKKDYVRIEEPET